MVDKSFIVVVGGELDLRVRLEGTVKNTQIDIGLYILEEKGISVMRIMGERERERKNKERVHDGGTLNYYMVLPG